MIDISHLTGIIRKEEGTIPRFVCHDEKFEDLCFALKSHYGYLWLMDIIALDLIYEKGFIELRYLFSLVESNYHFFLVIELKKNQEMKSVAHMWSNASTCEHELNELFGIKFNRAYKSNYFAKDNKIHPMLKDELRSPLAKMELPTGEIYRLRHPFKSNLQSFSLEERDNLISRCDVNSGHYHIGLEKILENLPLKDAYHLLENYLPLNACDLAHLLSYIVENENNITIPDRAKAIRMVFLELSRVINHLFALRDLTHYFCISSYQSKMNIWIKKIQSLMMSASGNEYAQNFIRIGGITRDVTQGWMSRMIKELSEIELEIMRFYKLVTASEEWKENLDMHILSKTEATNRSLSGPIVRATGLNLDYRKIQPIYFYQDVHFDIPIGTAGTLLDLFSVKIEEIFQSFSIIIQVLDNLPTGRYMADQFLEYQSLKKQLDPVDENHYLEKTKHLYDAQDFDGYHFIEAGNGLMAMNLVYRGNKIQRIKLLSNDFYIKGLFEQLIKGRDRSSLELLWISLSPDMKLVER